MEVSVRHRPSYAAAYLKLSAGESAHCEPGSMMAMSSGMVVAARPTGGLVQAALRRTFTQEDFFLARYEAQRSGAWVAVAPTMPGDVMSLDVVHGSPVVLQQGAFLAHSDGVRLTTKVADVQTFALRKGATLIGVEGAGRLVLASYGAIERIDLDADETVIVDTGHMVAWSAAMRLRIGPLRGVVSSALTREGLVGEFTGPGVLLLQTRSEQGDRSWLQPRGGQDAPPARS